MSTQETEKFIIVYERLKTEMVEQLRSFDLGPVSDELIQYYTRCIDYNVLGGKLTRGLTVIKATEAALGGSLEDSMWEKAAVLGWLVEILQALFLVSDDVMDNSVTRRGHSCWYRLPEVTQANAINDSLILQSWIYQFLENHFEGSSVYVDLFRMFQQATYRTIIGQHLDTNSQLVNKPFDVKRITKERYSVIVQYKTAYYTFYLPCAVGLILGEVKDDSTFKKTKNICMQLGEYFQAQDDYLDCYADADVLGKVGRDIEEHKCSWLACEFLNRCTEIDRHKFQENYGNEDKTKVDVIKQLYNKYEMPKIYAAYEDNSKANIDKSIASIEKESLQSLFNFLLSKIYKRGK